MAHQVRDRSGFPYIPVRKRCQVCRDAPVDLYLDGQALCARCCVQILRDDQPPALRAYTSASLRR